MMNPEDLNEEKIKAMLDEYEKLLKTPGAEIDYENTIAQLSQIEQGLDEEIQKTLEKLMNNLSNE